MATDKVVPIRKPATDPFEGRIPCDYCGMPLTLVAVFVTTTDGRKLHPWCSHE